MKRTLSAIIAAVMLTAVFAIVPSAATVPTADIFSLSFTKDGITDVNNGIDVVGFSANHQDDDLTKSAINIKDYMIETTYNLGKGDIKAYAFNKTDKGTNIVGVFTASGAAAFGGTRNDENGFSVEIIMTVPDPSEGDKWYPTDAVGGDGVKGSWVLGSGTNGGGWGLHFDENGKFAIYMRCKDSKNIMKSTHSFTVGEAVDVVYTFNGDDNVSLYVNGVLEASMTLATTGTGHTTSSKYIGITNDAFNGGVNGAYSFGASKIFGYNLYGSALSASEVKALFDYHAAPNPSTSDSTALSVVALVASFGLAAVVISKKSNRGK